MSLQQIPHNQLLESTIQLTRNLDSLGSRESPESNDSQLLRAYLREIERRKLHAELGFTSAENFVSHEISRSMLPNGRQAKPRVQPMWIRLRAS